MRRPKRSANTAKLLGRIGVRGGIRTHGPRIRTTSACAAALPARQDVRGLDCPFTIGLRPQVPPIQSLHLPGRAARAWLGIGAGAKRARLSPTLSGSVAWFPLATPSSKTRNPVLYPAELRGQPAAPYRSHRREERGRSAQSGAQPDVWSRDSDLPAIPPSVITLQNHRSWHKGSPSSGAGSVGVPPSYNSKYRCVP
jgi:hypothetical protein